MTQVMNARELADELDKIESYVAGLESAQRRQRIPEIQAPFDALFTALRATPDREAVLEEAARAVEALNGLIWASAAAATIRALKSSPTDPVARAVEGERGWLIEEDCGGFFHWIALKSGEHPFHTVRRRTEDHEFGKFYIPLQRTKDANQALRFAREQDAQAFIDYFGRFLLNPVATEHEWHGPAPKPEGSE